MEAFNGRECDGRYCLAVPNHEIRNIITERVMRLFGNEVKQDGKSYKVNILDIMEQML